MEFDEIWGIAAERIEEFFSAQSDALREGEDFALGAVRVTVEPLPPNMVFGWPLPRTRVYIRGVGAEGVYRRFYLRFLSAGG